MIIENYAMIGNSFRFVSFRFVNVGACMCTNVDKTKRNAH